MDSGGREMNPVAMTIINPQQEYWLSRELNHLPPVLESAKPQTELRGSAALIAVIPIFNNILSNIV